MAIQLITQKWCDVHAQDGVQAEAETVSVSLNGEKPQAIELCPECVAKYVTPLKEILVSEGRVETKGRATKKTSALVVDSKTSAKEIREWARSNGYDVPDRGQIPGDVRDAFSAAH